MDSQWTRKLALIILLLAVPSSAGPAISYCSPDLTAGSFQAVYNQWQTNDVCAQTCSGYAYAINQGPNCWCSDYAPASQVSTYDCNTVCPGWQTQWCGNTAKGLYGYYQLDGATPKGTAGGSSATSGSSVSNTLSRPGSSVAPSTASYFRGSSSLTMTASVQTTIGTSSSTVRTISAVSSPSITRSVATTSSIATITQVVSGTTYITSQTRTILVTSTPSSDSTLSSGAQVNSSGGVSTGTVVGIVLGVALGLGLFIGLGVWFCLRRKHQRRLQEASLIDDRSAHSNTGIPSRQVSQMSSAGLLGKAPRIQTTGLPSGVNPRSADTASSNVDRRSLGTDQRLNPYAIYAHDESRHSNVSLQDNQDYSRQLRARVSTAEQPRKAMAQQ